MLLSAHCNNTLQGRKRAWQWRISEEGNAGELEVAVVVAFLLTCTGGMRGRECSNGTAMSRGRCRQILRLSAITGYGHHLTRTWSFSSTKRVEAGCWNRVLSTHCFETMGSEFMAGFGTQIRGSRWGKPQVPHCRPTNFARRSPWAGLCHSPKYPKGQNGE